MAIELKNMARVEIPEELRLEILGSYFHTARNGDQIKNYLYNKQDGYFLLPLNERKLASVAKRLNETIVDLRSMGDPLRSPYILNPAFCFRPHQIEPASALLSHCEAHNYGVLHAGCGCGKTVVMTWVAGHLNTRVLILVDMGSLQTQWQEAFKLVWNKDAQILDRSATEFADVCIVTFQLLHSNPGLLETIRKKFGCVLLDEFHSTQSTTRRNVLMRLNSKYRIGCTATLMKKGFSEEVLTDMVSDVSVTMVDHSELKPDVYFVPSPTKLISNNPDDWGKIMSKLGKDGPRNQFVLELAHDQITKGRKVLVIGVTVESLKGIHNALKQLDGCRPKLYVGSTTLAQDKELRDQVAEGTVNCVLTVKKGDKGLDLPSLDCLILARPNNSEAFVTQIAGRVVRYVEGKPNPEIYDVVDQGSLAETFAKNRRRWYQRLKYPVKNSLDGSSLA